MRKKHLFVLFSSVCLAFQAKASEITLELKNSQAALENCDQKLSLQVKKSLKDTLPNQRRNLSPSLQKLLNERIELSNSVLFWENSLLLKNDLLKLSFQKEYSENKNIISREDEAELISKTAIQGFAELKKKYHMLRPAVLQNTLINAGIKKQGFCWHWTRDLMHRIEKLPLHHYDFQWATAYKGKLREHNTLVILPRGHSLEDGLLLDGWRHSGKPFWILVKKDKKYPWKEGSFGGIEMPE